MKKPFLFLAILLLASSWMLTDPADPIGRLRERIDAFTKKYHRAKLDLLFNQPRYAPGDTVLIRTLYLSADSRKPVEGRQIVYIELFDTKGGQVLRNQIRVENGYASNALRLPENLDPGIYLLVAYSDWMRNLDPSLFFRKEFTVTGKEKLQHIPAPDTKLDFYPEGGTLIVGVENNLILHISNGSEATVNVRSESGSLPVIFDHHGLAELKITPQPGAHYIAEMNSGRNVTKLDLPTPRRDGIAMTISPAIGQGGIQVKLSPGGLSEGSRKFNLVVTNNQGLLYAQPLEFTAMESVRVFLPEDLPTGVAQVAIVDENLRIWAQRLIMVHGKESVNVRIKTSAPQLTTREPAAADVELTDNFGRPVKGTFTARIISQDLFQDSSARSFEENLLLYSDLATTYRLQGPADPSALNRYLITQSSPWLDWDKMALAAKATPAYQPRNNMVITGKAVFLETGQPVPDSSQIWFFLQREMFGYEVTTGHSGAFSCPILFDFEGTDEVFFAALRKGADLNNVILQGNKQDSVYGFAARPFSGTKSEDAYGVYAIQKNTIDRSFSFYANNRQKNDSLVDPNARLEDELQGADVTLTVSDYVLFPTMQDLIREVLPSVDYRKIRGRDVVRVYTTQKAPSNNASPLFVIDGVMTKNASTFVNLKPSELLSIKVVKRGSKLVRFGALGANGVILVRSRKAGTKTMIQKDNTFPLVGMTSKYKPGGGVRFIPDVKAPVLKPCLLWSPNETVGDDGKAHLRFFTSDDVGKFSLQIEGITAGGQPFYAEQTIPVKFAKP